MRYLDRNHIRYDLTSDLDLALSDSPRASDRKAVLLAGSMRWVTRAAGPPAAPLRAGRRAGRDLRARHAAPRRHDPRGRRRARGRAAAADPAEPPGPVRRAAGAVRRAKAPEPIAQLGGDPAYGLFVGTGGTLDGFSAFEESVPPEEGGKAKLLGAMGVAPPEPDPNAPADEPPPEQRYALTAIRLGEKGLIVRVGLPQWTRRLEEPQISQVTRNIIDLLRGQEPKIR